MVKIGFGSSLGASFSKYDRDDHEGLSPEEWRRKYPQGKGIPTPYDPSRELSRAICKHYGYHRVGGFDIATRLAWACWKKDGPMFHIFATSNLQAYPWTFARVSKFQERLARVVDGHEYGKCHCHITPDGKPAYSERYFYVGNFSLGFADVEISKGEFGHINRHGELAYDARYLNVGHFTTSGLAQAKDANGWFHVDHFGQPSYSRRFLQCGPFNNGLASVEFMKKKGDGVERVRRCINSRGEVIDPISLQVLPEDNE